jgi:hypothetical protein
MAKLKIKIFKDGQSEPSKTITIPDGFVSVASKLMPKEAASALESSGIDLNNLVKMSKDSDALGVLVDVDVHDKNKRIVVALE